MDTYTPNYTGNGWAGTKYHETKDIDIKDIAKMVRNDIKQQLPGFNTSVKIQRYAGGQSLGVDVTAAPAPLQNPNFDYNFANDVHAGRINSWNDEEAKKLDRYTAAGIHVKEVLKKIVDAYRHDDSDGMTDYFDTNFYAHIDVSC